MKTIGNSILIFFLIIFFNITPLSRSAQSQEIVNKFDFNVQKKSEAIEAKNTTGNSEILTADKLTHEFKMTQERNKLYECIILAVGLVVTLSIILWFMSKKPSFSANNIMNASALILIIYGTIFIVVLSDAEAQLTASIGVLGAIAGYLFGTMHKRDGSKEAQ